MASKDHTRVIAVQEVDPEEAKDYPKPDANGIVSCKFVLYEDMDDETLDMLWEADPGLVMEKRPDWVKIHFPDAMN